MTTTERRVTIWRLATQLREAGKDTRDADEVLGKLQKLKRPGGSHGEHMKMAKKAIKAYRRGLKRLAPP